MLARAAVCALSCACPAQLGSYQPEHFCAALAALQLIDQPTVGDEGPVAVRFGRDRKVERGQGAAKAARRAGAASAVTAPAEDAVAEALQPKRRKVCTLHSMRWALPCILAYIRTASPSWAAPRA